jgi:hypothetical protein
MEWDQITEKWADMTRRLCHDGAGAQTPPSAPPREGSAAPSEQPGQSTLAPRGSASPDP